MKRLVCVLAVIVWLLAGTSVVTAGPLSQRAAAPTRYDLKRLKPRVVWKRIPYGRTRRRQMAAYSKRHYGKWSWHLTSPKVIIEHYTDGLTWQGAWNTFAANTKHYGEYPGTCAHFIIDTDGTIYQLVPLWIRCRHAMGMNWTSFGIEHVGTSDASVLGNPRQLASSLALTLWLAHRYGIVLNAVIGHNESLRSPYHRERYPAWRCQTHGDWTHADMTAYRGRLAALARREGVPLGPGQPLGAPNC